MVALSGGKRLANALAVLASGLQTAATVEVGFMEGGTYPDGTSIPLVAAVNEYGKPAKGQPPRPYFRNMIAAKSGEWPDALGDLLKKHKFNAKAALAELGVGIAGQLQQSIVDLVSPPLKQSTIDAKGFDKPLIDTSVMINSVTSRVK